MTVPAFQITGLRLSPRTTVEWPVVAFFDIAIAGVSIQRCRLLLANEVLFVRGPAFDKKHNPSFGRVDFKDKETRRAITAAVMAIYNSMGGGVERDEIGSDRAACSGIIQFADAKRAAHG